MRTIQCLTLLALLASAPASAQSIIPLEQPARAGGPNAQASQRPLGPNAQATQAAQRPSSPNLAVLQTSKAPDSQIHYPTCAAAGAVRTTPFRQGEPGYGRHLDRDGNRIACD